MNKIKERLQEMAEYYGFSIRKFEEYCNLKRGNISNIADGGSIGSDKLSNIIDACANISPEWLITGNGAMLREQLPAITPIYKPKQPEPLEHHRIPLYDVAAAANLQTLFCNREQNILGEISIPNIPKCDGAVYISGDSMYPILKAGDIVAYKEIRDPANIIFGEMYLVSLDIEGDDYLTIKYINHSDIDQCVKLVSYNTYHQPKDIPITSIKALAIVKLSIRKNTM